MSNITNRKMQAESDANKDIASKDFQHTSAYQILHIDDPANNTSLDNTSSTAIKEALLKRAKAKQMGLDKFNYENSKIRQHGYKKSAFDNLDDEARGSILGTLNAAKKKEKEKRERFINRDRKQRFNATGDADNTDLQSSNQPNNRQDFNSKQPHSFKEPTGRNYNPYA